MLLFFSCTEPSKEEKKSDESEKKETIKKEKVKKEKIKESEIFFCEKFGFEVDFGGKPRETQNSINQSGMKIDYDLYTYEKKKIVYFVSVNSFPSAITAITSEKAMLDGAKAGLLGQLEKAVLISEEDIELAGNTGREITAKGKKQGEETYIKGRIFMIDKKLFQIYAASQKNNVDESAVEMFLNSFKLKN